MDIRGARACPFCLARTCCNGWRPLAGSGRGHVGVVVKSHLGAWSGFHATVGLVSVRWNHGAIHA